ncbi:hypothetical protein OJAV_G00010440 [Oryzias javanicus]|uniref:Uncharacterized protein n=1 Tax=Oryzias javanicus TaxID=123683 RepID=A0A437DNM0_ORYJA|nr:hypothetical protein OJAV_G00010440 [Oryzias javanicus]
MHLQLLLLIRASEPRMKPQSWLRRNWLLAAGGAFVTIHLSTWILQKVMKRSVRSEVSVKQNAMKEKTD